MVGVVKRSAAQRGVRWTWMLLGSIVTVVVVGWGTVSVVGVLAHEEYTEVTVFEEPVEVLDLRTSAGSVEIIGTDTDVVTLTAEISDGLFDSSSSAVVEDGRLEIRASCPEVAVSPWCSIRYTVEIPASLAVDVSSSHGSVSVSDVDGPVTVSSNHGGITLTRVDGDVSASTDHGNLRGTDLGASRVDADTSQGSIHLAFAEAPEGVSVTTRQGGSEIVLPDTAPAYRVDAAAGGSVNTQIRTDPAAEFAITARASHGSITIRYA